jgi:hypothetical protein
MVLGSFTVGSVLPGQYVILVTGTPAGDFAEAIINVIAGPTLSLTPPPTPSVGSAISNIYSSSSGLGFEETANAFDNAGVGFIMGHRNPPKIVFVFTDSTRVNTGTGQLLFSPDYSNAVVVAGPLANPTTAYYETHGLAPLTFSSSGGNAIFMQGGSTAFLVSMASITSTNDYFIMEAFQDGGHTVVVLYGIQQQGTLASGVYFDSFVITNTAAYTASAYIIHWQGTNPNVPLPTDTYTIVYHS